MPQRKPNAAARRTERAAAVIVTGAEADARDACLRAGIAPVLMLSREACLSNPLRTRGQVSGSAATLVAIHSVDWQRQSLQPLLEIVAGLLPGAERIVVLGDGERVMTLSPGRILLDAAILPARCASAALRVGAEMRRFQKAVEADAPALLDLDRAAVLAIWRGDPSVSTGGAVTHAAGMLGALRRHGLRVGLLTMCEPPPRLREAVDDIEVAAPLSPAARITREIEDICLNQAMIEAGERLLERLRPAFVYQRYDSFMTCGIELAGRHELPLVLEWNGSAAWVRRHWRTAHRAKHVFDRMLLSVEAHSLQRSLLVRAVSARAAEMAIEGGARADRVVAIANAVDIDAIPAPDELPSREQPLIGWVGSFGPWHGAPLLIEALAQLPKARAVLVGEGLQRMDCVALAHELGVEQRVEWTGTLSHEQAVARMRECDVLASPHVPTEGRAFFGSPTKIFEFMAIGRPIVASALEQIGEVLQDGRTACLVRPGDANDLARGLQDVLALPDRGRALGLAARAEAQRHHTWSQRAEQLLQSLAAVSGDAPPARSPDRMPQAHSHTLKASGDPVAYFDEMAGAYASWTQTAGNFGERRELFAQRIRACHQSRPSDICLDLGCGNGELTLLAAQLGFQATGFDGSSKMIELAAGGAGDRGNVAFRRARLPLPEALIEELRATAGLVIASSVIEYLDADAIFLAQCAALLKPGGRALISFPNASSPWRRLERLIGARGPFSGTVVEVQRRHYRLADVEALAAGAGLTVQGAHRFGLPLSRILGRVMKRPPGWLATLMLVELRRPDQP